MFSGTGTIGEVVLVEDTPFNWNIKEGVYSIKPNQKKIRSKFLMHLLRSTLIREGFLQKAAGGIVKSVPMGELRKLKVPVPSLEEQQRIVSILDRLTRWYNALKSGLPAEIAARRTQ